MKLWKRIIDNIPRRPSLWVGWLFLSLPITFVDGCDIGIEDNGVKVWFESDEANARTIGGWEGMLAMYPTSVLLIVQGYWNFLIEPIVAPVWGFLFTLVWSMMVFFALKFIFEGVQITTTNFKTRHPSSASPFALDGGESG